jgi:hypothetical protein
MSIKLAFIQDNVVVKKLSVESIDDVSSTFSLYQNVIEIDGLDPEPDVGWVLQGSVLIDPTGTAQPLKRISKLKFAQRFTDVELATIESYAWQSTPTAAALRAALRKQMIAEYIDLALPETATGLLSLVGLGLITADRASVILNTPVSESEKYRG